MDYDLSDLKLEIWALDGENKYPQHVWTVAGGSYAGNYVNYSGATYAGKYIMTIAGLKQLILICKLTKRRLVLILR